MAKIDNAYAYYISTYAQKTVSRYDSHKKSEPVSYTHLTLPTT